MATLTAAQVAELVKRVGFPNPTVAGLPLHVIMTATAKAESGYREEVVNSIGCVGLFQVNAPVHKKYDARRLKEGEYNTKAALDIYKSQGLRAWEAYTNGAYKKFVDEARRGVASASGVTGTPATGGGTPSSGEKPSITYGPPSPEAVKAGVGVPLVSAHETLSPLSPLKIFGSEIWADYSTLIVGKPMFEAGIETIPNLKFSISDPEGDLMFRHRNVFVRGARVQYVDLNMRLDTLVFEPGPAGTGQITITAIDDIVYALMQLQGPVTASGLSAVDWLHSEMFRANLRPSKSLLGEAVVTQSQIARDIPDQQGTTGAGAKPSGWTTIVRLAKELGKRVFISGSRIVFGSSAFAMRWTAPGAIQISRHALGEGEKWLSLPSAKFVTIGSRSDVLEVTGKVPFNRALFFRPGVPVAVRNTPSVAGDEFALFMCSKVSFGIGTDVDGADVTLLAPVDPPAEPPSAPAANGGSTSAGTSVSGGGADGQVDKFVALALQQAGDRYVFGAEAKASDPDPRVFDCCILGGMLVYTANRGPVPVEEIEIGDTVWGLDQDQDGALVSRPVVAWARQRARPIHRVRTRNREVDVTGNHPFLRAVKCPRERDEKGRWKSVEWKFEWTNADQLVRGDLLVTLDAAVPDTQAHSQPTLPDGTEVTEDVAWLFGAITGNGWVSDNGVVVSVFKPHIVNRVRKTFDYAWGRATCWYPKNPERGVLFNSRRVAAMFQGLGYVHKARDKKIPSMVFSWPHRLISAYLEGYADTDGHYDKRGHTSYSSSSLRLLAETRALHLMLGDAVSNVTAVTQKNVVIRGKQVLGRGRLLHSFTYYPESPRRDVTLLQDYGLRRFLPEPWSVRRVQSVDIVGEDETFDIQVEGTHNFIAEGLVVSNSELVEWAASRAGISPAVPDGSAAQKAHCSKHGTLISVQQGINTKGALLFAPGHVAISLGSGKTIEAMNPSQGVRQGNANGRNWNAAGRIPGAKGYR